MRLAHRFGLRRRSQFLGLGLLALIGASQIRAGWLSAVVFAAGIAMFALGITGLFAVDRERRKRGVPTKP